MIRDHIFLFFVCASLVLASAVGFVFTPLIPPGPAGETGSEYQTHIGNEMAHCQANLKNMNCRCFARTAAHILSEEGPRVRGFFYVDRSDLARAQAGSGC